MTVQWDQISVHFYLQPLSWEWQQRLQTEMDFFGHAELKN